MCKRIESDLEHIESEKGEKIMFRRFLIKQLAPDEPKHRRPLFRIKCKILGKVCKVVVDSGSIDNVILEEVFSKVKL